ncbi:MAG: hypothetical protein JWN46_1, partial [Acidimicrobiales bacterium]|nr:hypothetical protein [Acidimicrobiales bacterium]
TCRPGVTGAEVRAVALADGGPAPTEPILLGVGLGLEPPVVTREVGADVVLVRSMVVAVSAWVAAEGVGGWYERRLVAVDDPPRLIGPQPGAHA